MTRSPAQPRSGVCLLQRGSERLLCLHWMVNIAFFLFFSFFFCCDPPPPIPRLVCYVGFLVICISPLHLPLYPCDFPHELCRGVCLCVSVLWGGWWWWGGAVGSGLQLPLLPCNLQLAQKYVEMFHKSANLPPLKKSKYCIPQKS